MCVHIYGLCKCSWCVLISKCAAARTLLLRSQCLFLAFALGYVVESMKSITFSQVERLLLFFSLTTEKQPPQSAVSTTRCAERERDRKREKEKKQKDLFYFEYEFLTYVASHSFVLTNFPSECSHSWTEKQTESAHRARRSLNLPWRNL